VRTSPLVSSDPYHSPNSSPPYKCFTIISTPSCTTKKTALTPQFSHCFLPRFGSLSSVRELHSWKLLIQDILELLLLLLHQCTNSFFLPLLRCANRVKTSPETAVLRRFILCKALLEPRKNLTLNECKSKSSSRARRITLGGCCGGRRIRSRQIELASPLGSSLSLLNPTRHRPSTGLRPSSVGVLPPPTFHTFPPRRLQSLCCNVAATNLIKPKKERVFVCLMWSLVASVWTLPHVNEAL
jgi:hypothetical protein